MYSLLWPTLMSALLTIGVISPASVATATLISTELYLGKKNNHTYIYIHCTYTYCKNKHAVNSCWFSKHIYILHTCKNQQQNTCTPQNQKSYFLAFTSDDLLSYELALPWWIGLWHLLARHCWSFDYKVIHRQFNFITGQHLIQLFPKPEKQSYHWTIFFTIKKSAILFGNVFFYKRIKWSLD